MNGINTSGFQVRQMPQFHGVSPSLVAFNPSAVSEGLMQAFQAARQYEALKASKALQAELEATQRGRVMAANRGYDVNIAGSEKTLRQLPKVEEVENLGLFAKGMTAIPEANYRLLQMEQDSRALPAVTSARISDAGTRIMKNEADIPTFIPLADDLIARSRYSIDANNLRREALPVVVGAETDEATARGATARNITQLAPLSRSTKEAQLLRDEVEAATKERSTAELAELRQNVESEQLQLAEVISHLSQNNAPHELQLKAIQTAQALKSADSDEDFRKARQRIDLLLKESQAFQNYAQGEYALGLGRQSGTAKTPEARAKELQTLLKQLDSETTGDNTRTVPVYGRETYNPDGSLKKTWGGFGGPVAQDPVGDAMLSLKRKYQQELLELEPLIGTTATRGGPPSQPIAPNIPASHIKALRANPDKASDFDALYGRGAAAQILK